MTLPRSSIIPFYEIQHILEDLKGSNTKYQTRIIEGLVLSSKKWNGVRYVSLTKGNDFLTVPLDSWRLLVFKLQEIGERLGLPEEEQSELRRKLFSSKGESCSQFFVEIVNKGKVIWASIKGFLSRSVAEQVGNFWMKKNAPKMPWDTFEVQISEKPTPPPCDTKLMKTLFINDVLKRVEIKSLGSCEGCEFNEPGQEAHMGWGACLVGEKKKVVAWMSHILCDINPQELSSQFDRLRKELGLRPKFSLQLAKAAVAYLDQNHVRESLTTFWEEGSTKQILQVVRDLEFRFD